MYGKKMAQLDKDDLAQMNEDYFKSLKKERLVEVAKNLHQLATDLWEKKQENSENSSQPPSQDNPYQKKSSKAETEPPEQLQSITEKNEEVEALRTAKKSVRKPGKQPGGKGFGRNKPLKVERIVAHYPDLCSACNENLKESNYHRYMGHYVLELEVTESGFAVETQLHHYYRATCSCGHCTHARPGQGKSSVVEGRSKNLQLTEYVLVGSVLATFIASLGVRYRMSRSKIQEFLFDWVQTELSIGTIDRCIREVGIACVPVVEELVEQLQSAEILHLDETHWTEGGKLYWLWVAITTKTAVFNIGSRRKEELSSLVTEKFMGWLISDGYGAYRSYPKRQRCLAHLIRKAIAITGAVNPKIAVIGQWLLDDLRELITKIANTGEKEIPKAGKLLARLSRVCHFAKKADHIKLRALAKEILNDWDAVVAFVNHPELPPTNNEAERALRHAVIARRIGYGTRTSEGSLAYSSLLTVIETCRLRELNPWIYLAQVLALARKGVAPPPFPVGS